MVFAIQIHCNFKSDYFSPHSQSSSFSPPFHSATSSSLNERFSEQIIAVVEVHDPAEIAGRHLLKSQYAEETEDGFFWPFYRTAEREVFWAEFFCRKEAQRDAKKALKWGWFCGSGGGRWPSRRLRREMVVG
jgi:hypothetical protein